MSDKIYLNGEQLECKELTPKEMTIDINDYLTLLENKDPETDKDYVPILETIINVSRYMYHNVGVDESKMPLDNNEYDDLVDEYEKLTGNRLIGQIELKEGSGTERIVDTDHDYPVLNCYMNKEKDTEGVFKWLDKVGKTFSTDTLRVLVMYKYNGVGAVMTVIDGVIKKVVTRGDTNKGVDITDIIANNGAVCRFSKAKEKLSGEIGVKVEVVMTYDNLDKLNREHDFDYKNPLSAVSGLLNRIDGYKYSKYLSVVPLEVTSNSEHNEDYLATINALFAEDINLEGLVIEDKIDMIEKKFQIIADKINSDRPELDYSIDGLIVEIADMDMAENLGIDNSYRNYQVAYKFPDETKESEFVKMDYEIGFTGKLNGRMWYQPVVFEGKTMQKTSMGSRKKFDLFDLHEDDKINVRYSNGVLCDIEPITQEHTGPKVKWPTKCPSCNGKLEIVGADSYCRNPDCGDKKALRITHFAERLDIRHLGPASVEKLYGVGYIKNPADLFELGKAEFIQQLGENGLKIKRQIDKIKKDGIFEWQFFKALCIPNVGERIFKKILVDIKPDTLINVVPEDLRPKLLAVEGIGETTADVIISYIDKNYDWIKILFNTIPLNYDERVENGLIAVLTGTRDKNVIKKLKDAGYQIDKQITENTNLLVYKKPGTRKYNDAKKIDGITMKQIDELDDYLTV